MKLYDARRKIFNDKYDPLIRGFEVELYVEPAEDRDNDDIPDSVEESLTEAANSNGVYSLINGWIKRPVKDNIPDEINLEPALTDWIERSKECDTIEEIDDYIDELYILRQEGLLNGGEYSAPNLIFKEIRSRGILQDLRDKKVELENDEMSLGD